MPASPFMAASPDTKSLRLFIAIALSPTVRAAVEDAAQRLRRAIPSPALRWVQPESLHLTLRFLGDVPKERVPALIAALQEAARDTQRLRLALGDIGCFPNARAPRVVSIGVTGDDLERLRVLQARIESAVAPLCGREDKAFHPHLTIARVKTQDRREARQIGEGLSEARLKVQGEWEVGHVELMSSELRPSGPVYEVVESVAFAA